MDGLVTQAASAIVNVASMPDWVADSDDDEWIEPWYNDTGEFGEQQEEDEE